MNRPREADGKSHTTRRIFCTDLMLTTAGMVLAGSHVTKVMGQDTLVAYPPRKIEGAERLQPGSSLYFTYPTSSDPAVLLRTTEGEYRAFSRRCSHAGCSVDFDGSRKCLKCPCHQGAFDGRAGYVMFGPPRRPLDTIILQIRAGGQLWAIGKSFGGDAEIITQALRRR
jgi:Rieske Fe-S protein